MRKLPIVVALAALLTLTARPIALAQTANAVLPPWPGNETRTWAYGWPNFDDDAFSGVNHNFSGTGGAWYWQLVRLDLTPGTYEFYQLDWRTQQMQASSINNVDNAAFGLYKLDAGGTTASLIAGTMRERPDRGADAGTYSLSAPSTVTLDFDDGDEGAPVSITLEAGETYFIGGGLHKDNGTSTAYPFSRNQGTTNIPNGGGVAYLWKDDSNADTQDATDYRTGTPTAAIPDVLTLANADATSPVPFKAHFRTANLIVQELGDSSSKFFSGTTKHQFVPFRQTAGDFLSVQLENLVGTDGQTITCDFRRSYSGITGGAAVHESITSLIHDLGATNRITFAASNANMQTGEGDNSPDSEQWDLLAQFTAAAANGTANLWYLNRTDPEDGFTNYWPTRTHFGAVNSAQGEYTLTGFPTGAGWITVSRSGGSGTIDTLRVGSHVGVYFGDSQADNTSSAGIQLGLYPTAIHDALTNPPVPWKAGNGGNRATTTAAGIHEAGYLRFQHTSTQSINLSRIRGGCFVEMGMFVNDLNASVSGTTGTEAAQRSAAELAADAVSRLAYRAEIIHTNGAAFDQYMAIIDAPRFDPALADPDGVTFTQPVAEKYEALARFRDGCAGIAAAVGAPYVSAHTLLNPVSGVHTSDGIHVNSPGAVIVARQMARMIENDIPRNLNGGGQGGPIGLFGTFP